MSDTDWSLWAETQSTTDDIDGQKDDKESTDMSSTLIDDLSEYELIKVFTQFTFKERISLARVCQKWKNCIEKSFKSESVFNSSKVGSNTGITEKAICLLIRKCCNVRTIDLKGLFLFKSSQTETSEEETTDNIVVTIVSNCNQLQSIDFGSLTEFDQYFENNVQYFKGLKKLISSNISEKALNCVIDSENLETIDIHRNDNISRPELKRLGPKIKELELMESQVIDEVVIQDLCYGSGKNIKSLSIDIKDKSVLSLILYHLKQLKTLKMSLYSEDSNFELFSNLRQLKTLDLEVMDGMSLNPKEFTELIRSLKETNLIELKVILSPMNNIAVNDDSLQELRQNCQTIQTLVIRGANSMTGTGMYAIAQMKNLKYLDLKNCLNITDQIDIVITSCPLRTLILHNCSHISNAIVDTFIEKAKTSPKEKFYLDVIDTNVSQESLPHESVRPKNLKVLYENEDCIYDCDHGWDQQNGYNSGPEDDMDLMDDLDFYDDFNDYDDEDIDYEFS